MRRAKAINDYTLDGVGCRADHSWCAHNAFVGGGEIGSRAKANKNAFGVKCAYYDAVLALRVFFGDPELEKTEPGTDERLPCMNGWKVEW